MISFFLFYKSPSCTIQHELQQKDVDGGGLAVGAELNGYGDFHFTFVWVHKKDPESNGIWW